MKWFVALSRNVCLALTLKNKTKQFCTEIITLCRNPIQRVMCFVFALRRSFQRKALVRTKRCYFESEPLSSRHFSNILKPTRLARNLGWFLGCSYTIGTHMYSLNLPSWDKHSLNPDKQCPFNSWSKKENRSRSCFTPWPENIILKAP